MKKRIFLITTLLLISANLVFAANKWRNGTGENTILGTETVSDIDTVLFQRVVDPLDRLLSNYRENAEMVYASTSTLTVAAGEIACKNSGSTIVRFRKNTSSTTVTWADIDTGTEQSSTTYYLYAVCDADATTFTVKISTNSSTPSGTTYFKRLGTFLNDSSGDIENDTDTFINDNDYYPISTSTESIAAYGTVSNGGTIPLPSGWDSGDCHWQVGVGTPSGSAGTSDAIRDMKQTASVTASRVATCKRTRVYASTTEDISNVCTYIIACYR